jgi:hypothetical protein
MSVYLSRLKQLTNENFINTPYSELTKPTEVPFGSNVSTVMGHIVKNNLDKELTNHWWLLHLSDDDKRQVCTWPYSTRAEILSLNKDAITAEPIPPVVINHGERD